MAPLFVSGRAETDSSERASMHVIGVLFVSLNVGAAFSAHMFEKIEVFASEEVAGKESARGAVSVWKGIEPEH